MRGRKRVTVEFRHSPGSQVFIAGSFNDWSPTAKELFCDGDGIHRATLMLTEGRHEYKFVVDGAWCVDPDCPDWVPNSHGTLNSVLIV